MKLDDENFYTNVQRCDRIRCGVNRIRLSYVSVASAAGYIMN